MIPALILAAATVALVGVWLARLDGAAIVLAAFVLMAVGLTLVWAS